VALGKLKQKFFGAALAGVLAAGASIGLADLAANTNKPVQQTTAAPAATAHTTAVTAEQARAAQPKVQPAFHVASNTSSQSGAPVTLNYGSSISPELIASAARVLGEMGCPVTLVQRGSPTRVIAQTNGKGAGFNDPVAAATWALDNCRS
jgi:hypothetical protein